ncbi:MAG: hypothetical protein M3247_08770, partial [Thermoproteota archaeon]|nr:hypothetical protein [Thermoproteota archaeon]
DEYSSSHSQSQGLLSGRQIHVIKAIVDSVCDRRIHWAIGHSEIGCQDQGCECKRDHFLHLLQGEDSQ